MALTPEEYSHGRLLGSIRDLVVQLTLTRGKDGELLDGETVTKHALNAAKAIKAAIAELNNP